MLLGTLVASLLGNILTDWGINRAWERELLELAMEIKIVKKQEKWDKIMKTQWIFNAIILSFD